MDKQTLRERVWDQLEESGDARFPFPPHGRIPNFAGAKSAAERLTETAVWRAADVIKSNPDSPQRPVRRRALEAGKVVYMAVPRLSEEKCFLRLDPAAIDDIDDATTISGSSEHGVQVGPAEMEPIDLIVSGSVAVNETGARVGKGEGYSDLEFALLRECGLVDDDTPTASTVHEIQVVDTAIDTTSLDVPIDHLFTPTRSVRTTAPDHKPAGIEWESLSEDRIDAIPMLDRLRSQS